MKIKSSRIAKIGGMFKVYKDRITRVQVVGLVVDEEDIGVAGGMVKGINLATVSHMVLNGGQREVFLGRHNRSFWQRRKTLGYCRSDGAMRCSMCQ